MSDTSGTVLPGNHRSKLAQGLFWSNLKEKLKSELVDAETIRKWASSRHAPRTNKISYGERGSEQYGICSAEEALLFEEPGPGGVTRGRVYSGDLYCVVASASRSGWIKIRSEEKGKSGWLLSKYHFGISTGEYLILSSASRSLVRQFVLTGDDRFN